MTDDAQLWAIRAHIYRTFADDARAPTAGDIARAFSLTPDDAARALLALHDRHALFLEPGTTRIRLANPFSAIPTAYTVTIITAGGERAYWANCAWDSLGVIAALGASDGRVDAACAATGEPIRLRIVAGRVDRDGPELAHFLVPFRHWYDDLIHT